MEQQSAFFNQADTHVYADWLAASVFDLGFDTEENLLLSSFPDLKELYAAIESHQELPPLRAFGHKLQKLIQGRLFIDLACGSPQYSRVPRLLAQTFGAWKYIGVDLENVQPELRDDDFPSLGRFRVARIKNDVLDFLSHHKRTHKLFLFISGLELEQKSQTQDVRKIEAAISKLSKAGDVLLYGAGCPEFQRPAKKFRPQFADLYHRLYRVSFFPNIIWNSPTAN